jgi:hypothetical protein
VRLEQVAGVGQQVGRQANGERSLLAPRNARAIVMPGRGPRAPAPTARWCPSVGNGSRQGQRHGHDLHPQPRAVAEAARIGRLRANAAG